MSDSASIEIPPPVYDFLEEYAKQRRMSLDRLFITALVAFAQAKGYQNGKAKPKPRATASGTLPERITQTLSQHHKLSCQAMTKILGTGSVASVRTALSKMANEGLVERAGSDHGKSVGRKAILWALTEG